MPLKVDLPRSKRVFAILALALTAYIPTMRVGFLWDDHVMIEANPSLHSWSAQALKHDFTTDVFDGHGDPYYRPAQTLLNRLDYTIWGLHPFGYHLTNWLGHALNAVLVSELALALGLGELAAILAGCFFGVHPICVEQLMIIAGRAEIFGLCFVLLSVLLFLRESRGAWIGATLCFVGALLFKESGMITPVLAATALAYQGVPRRRYACLIPCLVLLLPYIELRRMAVGGLPPLGIPYAARFFIQAFPKVLLIYARLILIPWNLHSHRLMPHLSHYWPALLMVVMAIPLLLARRKMGLALFGVAWFILTLLPKTPAMIYGNFMLDHWAYPAAIGMLIPLAAGFTWLWERYRDPLYGSLAMICFPLLIFWALLVHLNVALRGTDEKMYRWALHFTTSHPIEYNLGVLMLQQKRPREALPYLYDYEQMYPDDPHLAAALDEAYRQIGHKRPPRRKPTR